MASVWAGQAAYPDTRELRATVEQLAGIPRLPTSAGEREAAGLIHAAFTERGCRVVTDEERAFGSYAWPIGVMSAIAAAAAVAAGRGHRVVGTLGAALAAWGIADDVTGDSMVSRHLFMRPGTTTNVIAETGDPDATRTLVVTVHHDAAPSGVIFDQSAHEWFADRHPALLERVKTNPPLWWPVVAGPALVSLGSLLGRPLLRRIGLGMSAASLAIMIDIGRRPAVPGANDNLSGVAATLALAQALQQNPVKGLRILLVSAGAEEALQQGIRAFTRRHGRSLPPEHTWFLNLDTVGSGRLVLLEAEGPMRMYEYDRGFKDLVAQCAAAQGITLRRGLRSRNSTDGCVPRRNGYPTASVVSVDSRKLLPHYHLDSDLPEHVDYDCVAAATRLAEAVARTLAVKEL